MRTFKQPPGWEEGSEDPTWERGWQWRGKNEKEKHVKRGRKSRKYILESDVNIIALNCASDKAWLKSAMAMSASGVIVIRLGCFSGLDRAHLSIVFCPF